MVIASSLLQEVVEHARAEAPNECCGIVGSRDGEAVRVYRARNKHASPLKFEIEEHDQIRIFNELEDEAQEVGAIYHSHTRTAPYPSQTDINLARFWPDPLWMIVGLSDGGEPEVRAYRILDGEVQEAELKVR